MQQQTQKVALVTGASRGIGMAIAERLAQDGFKLIINYSENAAPAEALVRKLEDAGGRAIAVKADISDPGAVRQMFDAAESAFGGIDVLVNNAGIMALAQIAETDDASFDRHIAVNLKGTFNTLREAAKRLRDGGRIVNFSSSVVGMLMPTYGVYVATKAAVEGLTSVLAKELTGSQHHGECRRPRPHRHRSLSQGETSGGRGPHGQDGSARASGPTQRHRGCRLVSRGS